MDKLPTAAVVALSLGVLLTGLYIGIEMLFKKRWDPSGKVRSHPHHLLFPTLMCGDINVLIIVSTLWLRNVQTQDGSVFGV